LLVVDVAFYGGSREMGAKRIHLIKNILLNAGRRKFAEAIGIAKEFLRLGGGQRI
jgi:hypothetical protein